MKNIYLAVVAVVVVAAGVFYYMGKSPSYQSAAPNQNIQQQAAATPKPTSGSAVTISNFAFSPATITVKAGTTVTWTNQDPMAHTVTSDSAGVFDSGNLATGKTFQFTFSTPGTYAYHCSVHPSMHGTVIVQ